MEQQKEIYRQEAYELLGELEEALLALEDTPDDADLVDRVFRALHTVKGSGAMFGFDDIAAFTHEVETVFDLIREGRMTVTRELVDLCLMSRDHVKVLLDADDPDPDKTAERGAALIAGIQKLVPGYQETAAGKAAPAVWQQAPPRAVAALDTVTYRIRFHPAPDLLKTGSDPLRLLEEIRALGDASFVVYTHDIPPLEALDPTCCFLYWDFFLSTDQGEDAIRDVFIFVEDMCRLDIKAIDALSAADREVQKEYKKLGEILIDHGALSDGELKKALGGQRRIGECLTASKAVRPGDVESAVVEQTHVRKVREKRQAVINTTSIRVDAERLDALVDLVGELVTVQARLSQKAGSGDDPDLLLIAEEVERLTTGLRDNAMGIRMLPIGTTFGIFKRLIRDLTQELGKEVTLVTQGSETELDKTVLDRLKDPLVHIIRNSIDHGIEAPEVRAAAGKPRQGRVHLSAAHVGTNVHITISDDGGGLDAAAIFQKAVERGIVAADAQLNASEVFNLIFEPGFSTAAAVTGVSGRGVGMDVVRRSIEALRGEVVMDSTPGRGTHITLKLPLTLAIIDGLMVQVGTGFFVIPLPMVEECVERTRPEVQRARERNVMEIRGGLVPYLRLRELFGLTGPEVAFEKVVIVNAGGERMGIGVDHVIGRHQTVIKSLGRTYRDVKGTSGATILGDGAVALILDINGLMHLVEARKATAYRERPHAG